MACDSVAMQPRGDLPCADGTIDQKGFSLTFDWRSAFRPGASTITSATINGTASLFLQGSIYLPTSNIALSGTSSSTLSPVTQVIGYSIDMQGTSDLTFNPDFEAAGYNVRGPDARVVLID